VPPVLHGANHFLECQQARVDLPALSPRHFTRVLVVCTALAAGEVDQAQLAQRLHRAILGVESHQHGRVGPRRRRVSSRGRRRPRQPPTVAQVKKVFQVLAPVLGQAHQLQHPVAILQGSELLAVVEEVVELLAVDLVHGQRHPGPPLRSTSKDLMRSEEVDTALGGIHVLHTPVRRVLPAARAEQRERLARGRLAKAETRAGATLEDVAHEVRHGLLVELLGVVAFTVGGVVGEVVGVHVLGQVHLDLLLLDLDLAPGAIYGVCLTVGDGALADHDLHRVVQVLDIGKGRSLSPSEE